MRVLLDTHAFLWWIFADARLSQRATAILEDSGTEVLFSPVSAWEIAIKARMGRLEMLADVPAFLVEQVRRNGLQVLPVEVHRLPGHHRDPFDRLLVAQAQMEGVPLVSRDPLIAAYGVETRW